MADAPATPPPAAPPAAKPSTPPAAAPAIDVSKVPAPFASVDAKAKGPPAGAPPKPDDKGTPPAKPDAGKGTPPASGTPPPPAKNMPKELRAEYDRLKSDLEKRNTDYAALEKRIADAERSGKDTTAMTTRLQEMEKRLADKEAQIRTYRYEASQECQEKYEKPFNDASTYAKSVVEQLQVTDGEGLAPRAARFDDFVELYHMPYAKAIETANAKFGGAAQIVINHMTELKRLEHTRNEGIKAEKAKIADSAKTEEAQGLVRKTALDSAWQKLNAELAEAEDYRESPDDKEAAELRQEGFQLFDMPANSVEEKLVKNAHIRQRVAAFAPNRMKITRLTQRVAELEAELNTLKNGPGPGRRPGGQASGSGKPGEGKPGESWEDAARKELIS